jgi:glycosyltransferase involved in cell wall biosynthesis
MPEYYSKIDVLVCASKIEGTPNPVLEAMACGVPVITTDVGIVPQAFGPQQKRFILKERSVEHLKAALKEFAQNRAILKKLSEENIHFISSWDWSLKVENFAHFFNSMLKKNRI